ncbi:MAG: phosphoribosylformylglycinamidine cyclo-ligase [Ignavibacteriales bacterium]|nr:phosphoribosylformylglycinamidine cyclo-ligase [Ignavibacteriales bacterium]
MNETYQNAGVSLEAGDETVKRIKSLARSTYNKNVLGDIGLFGSFYELDLEKYKRPILVSSVDGVGTKLKVAFAMDRHDTVGNDLVNHCVNDIAVCGAEPLYFLDYMAFGKLDPNVAEKIVEGFARGCRENNCALIGGETAEMPGLYTEGEYDMSGTIVGVVEKDRVINGSRITRGDKLIGFKSSGLHTNGYSLARKILFPKYSPNDYVAELNNSIGDELLAIHRSYLDLIRPLADNDLVTGLSHITGGGIKGNTMRIVPKPLELKINWNAWDVPAIFKFIQKTGSVTDEEMRNVFNMGIGLIAIVPTDKLDKALEVVSTLGEAAIIMGEVV